MAQWNPYYSLPDDENPEEDVNSQNNFNVSPLPYTVPPAQPFNYDYYPNVGAALSTTIPNPNLGPFVYYSDNRFPSPSEANNFNSLTLSDPLFSRTDNQGADNTNGDRAQTVAKSKLTATAKEFKPKSTNLPTNTYSSATSSPSRINTGAIPKNPQMYRKEKSPELPQSGNRVYDGKQRNRYDQTHGSWNKREPFHSDSASSGSFNDQNKYGTYRSPGSDRFDSDRNFSFRENSNRNQTRTNNRNTRHDNTFENWRDHNSSGSTARSSADSKLGSNSEGNDKNQRRKKKQSGQSRTLVCDVSQRDHLIEQVNRGTLECLVCYEFIRQTDKIWSCMQCFHIYHLSCTTKWANSSRDSNGWRCPACQHVCIDVPYGYFCYCGAQEDPVYTPGDIAHSCGELCCRPGIKPGCVHRCTLLCHPGPCPKCEALVSRKCCCGATSQMVKCSATTNLFCDSVCGKVLKCGLHTCNKICHLGDCEDCTLTMAQECYCGKEKRSLSCSKERKDVHNYCCTNICGKLLACKNHKCQLNCHPGACPPCKSAPDQISTCPCGKKKLEVVRVSCLDPIPCCSQICRKRYPFCEGNHYCKSLCHDGECPPCPLTSLVRCRCGHTLCEVNCATLKEKCRDVTCGRKCTKWRSCGKHKCHKMCCIDIDHICPLICNHYLSCGQHRCEQICHKGHCLPCPRVSFDELYCECGGSVIYPPIACGTKKPHCDRPCTRRHDCNHTVTHNCHTAPHCPPCTVFTTKWCYGRHEKRSIIPCHQKEFSCGLPCGKLLKCGRHNCLLPCHKGPCLKGNQLCAQPCTFTRETCEHACGLPCHNPPCPESPCKEMVKVTCECGNRSTTRACFDVATEYQRIATSRLASKMSEMQLGHSVDIADIMVTPYKRPTLKTLECNEECRIIERNRRLAIGLQIRNPDLSAKLTPRYSDYMRVWAKKDAGFCQMVHDKLSELVQLAKQSKQKSRSYSFPSMNRDKRHFIHEYCEHFGCEATAYDHEPNRNVVATAYKNKSWLPSYSLLEVLQRESGQRKVPGPVLNRPLGPSRPDPVSLRVPTSKHTSVTPSTSFASTVSRPNTEQVEDEIDYFNFPTQNK